MLLPLGPRHIGQSVFAKDAGSTSDKPADVEAASISTTLVRGEHPARARSANDKKHQRIVNPVIK